MFDPSGSGQNRPRDFDGFVECKQMRAPGHGDRGFRLMATTNSDR
jgi:hypothetical protein